MSEALIQELKTNGDKSLEAFRNHLTKLRTGRANPALLDGIKVNYYGNPTPLKQVATVSVAEGRVIVVQPWDMGAMAEIENSTNIAKTLAAPRQLQAIVPSDSKFFFMGFLLYRGGCI